MASLSTSGLTTTALFHRPMTGARFCDDDGQALVPALKLGDKVDLDNLPAYKVSGIRKPIITAGARLLSLSAESPGNPPQLNSP